MKKKKKGEGQWYRYKQGGKFYPAQYPFESDEKKYWYKEKCEEDLKDGDIYIYRVRYFLGEKMYQIGEIVYHEPEYRYENKIFIKMKGQTEISKIRWPGFDSVIDDDLLDILEKKLAEFDNKSDFDRKIHDMRLLNLLAKKVDQNIPLTVEELKFLYEIDNKMEDINSNKDYRIAEIIASRKSIAEDMNCIYNFKKINEYLDDLNLDIVKDPTGLKLPEITGSLSLDGLEKTEGLELPKIVKGNLKVAGVTESSYIVFSKIVEGDLSIFSVINSYETPILSELEKISKSVQKHVVSASQLILPEIVKGNLFINVTIKDFEHLKLPEVDGLISIDCPEKAEGLILPQVTNGLFLDHLASAEGVLFPETNKDCCLYLFDLKDTNGLILPKNVKSNIRCEIDIPDACFMEDEDYKKYRQTVIDKFKATKEICEEYNVSKEEIAFSVDECKKKKGQIRVLKANVNLKDVLENGDLNVLPAIIIGDVDLKEKTYLNDFFFKSNVAGNFNLSGLVAAKKVILSDTIYGNVELGSLTNVDTLILSKYIGGRLNLCGLENAREVVFSEVINKEAWLGNFDKENTKLPVSLRKNILTKNIPYDCFIDNDEFREYRSTKIEELNTIKLSKKVSKIKKLIRHLTIPS